MAAEAGRMSAAPAPGGRPGSPDVAGSYPPGDRRSTSRKEVGRGLRKSERPSQLPTTKSQFPSAPLGVGSWELEIGALMPSQLLLGLVVGHALLLALQHCFLVAGIPVLEVAALAGFVDPGADVEESLGVPRLDDLE